MEKSEITNKNGEVKAPKTEKFSEANEFNHERNQVSKAQKQMASQETTGVLDQQ
jgi:hypothetical protein